MYMGSASTNTTEIRVLSAVTGIIISQGEEPLEGQESGVKDQSLPAGCLLHPLVAIQDTLEQLCHQRLEVHVRWLADYPVGIAAQCPAGNGAYQGLLV